MTPRIPLSEQIEAIRIAAGAFEDQPAIAAALRTLEWLQSNESYIRQCIARRDAEIASLETHPAVKAVREEFPDAEIVDVREL